MARKEKPKRGRPRRYAPGRRPTLTFRVQEAMHRELTKTAKDNQRSISEEIERRLDEWGRLRSTELVRAIRQAGFQIVRDAGGNVTVNVSPELLLAEADGILRSGFIAEENIGKSPTEIMIERVLENLLAKHGLLGRKGEQ
jgi:hypothetical protein